MLKRRRRREKDLLNTGYRFAFALTHRESDAEDLVQTACVRLLGRYGKIESEALLLTAVRNLFYDRVRRDKIVAFEPLESHEESAEEATRAFGKVEARLDLEVLLSNLRPEEREALYLNVVAGYTVQEIADLTGRPANTVSSLMHRARQKLSEAVSNPGVRSRE